MATTTVQKLIEQLQRNHKPEDSIVFQYFVSDYTEYTEEEFAPIAEYLMDNESFGEESSNFFTAWLLEGESVLATLEEQDNQ